MTAPLPRRQASRAHQGGTKKEGSLGRAGVGGSAGKEGEGRQTAQSDDSGWAGSPSPGAESPSACWRTSLPSRVPGGLSPCSSGSSRKWLNPMRWYTPERQGQIFALYRRWGSRAG